MTPRELEQRFLSLRVWLLRVVLPASLFLILLLLITRLWISIPHYRDQTSAILGFFTLYYVLFRGGHIFMIRSLHLELKDKYGPAYEAALARLPANLRRHNLGFTLAKIKRRLIDAG